MKHGIHMKTAPNADGRYLKHDEDGVLNENMFVGTESAVPKMSDLEVERFLVIPPGGKKTISVTPLCGICNSMLMWPLPHASLVFEWQLQSDPSAICAGETGANSKPAHAATPYSNPIVRSQRWEIQLPRLLVPLVKLSDVADAEWSSLLSGEGLHADITQTVHLEGGLCRPRVAERARATTGARS